MELLNQVAVVTGGAMGIGKAIALALAKEGADVAIPDLKFAEAKETAAEIQSLGRKAVPIEADLSSAADVDRVFEQTTKDFGKIDILINNAGITHPTVSILDLDLEYVDKVYTINFKGVYLCSRQAGQVMVKQKRGCIINISSIAGVASLPLVVYGPMKSAVIMLTQILARDWAKFNVRVNSIAPGYILTPLIEKVIEKRQRDPELLIKRIPVGKIIEPEEVANAALFLASNRARYITGITLPVDGGWLSDGGWSAYFP